MQWFIFFLFHINILLKEIIQFYTIYIVYFYLFIISSMEKPTRGWEKFWDFIASALSLYMYSVRPCGYKLRFSMPIGFVCTSKYWSVEVVDGKVFPEAPLLLIFLKFCFDASVKSRTWNGSLLSSPRPVTSTSEPFDSLSDSSLSSELTDS